MAHRLGPFHFLRAALLAGAGLAGSPLAAETDFSGTAEVSQVFADSLGGGDDLRGWLDLGINANYSIATRQLNGFGSVSYGRRIEEFGRVSRNDRLNGLANLAAELVDERVFVNVGGQAGQYPRDARGFASIGTDIDSDNDVQVYSAYVAPRVRQPLGNIAVFDADYRFGVTWADGPGNSFANSGAGVDGLRASRLDNSVSHSASASLTSNPRHRISVAATGNYIREDIDRLNQDYEALTVQGRLTIRVRRGLEIFGSGGYEDILNEQDSILFDPVTGFPVLDANGEFVVDPANPRRTAFDREGAIGEGGFRWTPSRRTLVEASAGHRFGGRVVNARAYYRAPQGLTYRASYSDSIESFGRLLSQGAFPEGTFAPPPGPDLGLGLFDDILCRFTSGAASGLCGTGITLGAVSATFRSSRALVGVVKNNNASDVYAEAFYRRRLFLDLQQLQVANQPDLSQFQGEADTSYGVRVGGNWTLDPGRRLGASVLYSRNDFALQPGRTDNLISGSVDLRQGLRESLYLTARFNLAHRAAGSGLRDSTRYAASVGIGYEF